MGDDTSANPQPSGGGGNQAPPRDNHHNSNPRGGGKRKFDSVSRGGARGRGRGRGRGGGGGGRGGRGGGRGQGAGEKKQDQGDEDGRTPTDKRERNREWQDKKRRRAVGPDGEPAEASYMNIRFPEEEIKSEERRPKRKVSVMIGYAGTGYHGLQINHREKTIEGDLFAALVAAEAISKANADDPRKSSFVRCARTDKGVHAAGNMVSLKLIIEDPDLVRRINEALPPQIRVWGIHRTNNAFSCYQACDSRWYEYLMPSYCLLPPHPDSFLGRKVLEAVREHGVQADYDDRLSEVKNYWAQVEENDIKPILDGLDPDTRAVVERRMHAISNTVPREDTGAATKTKAPETEAPEISSSSGEAPLEAVVASETESAPAQQQQQQQQEPAAAADGEAGDAEKAAPSSGEAGDAEAEAREANPADLALKRVKAAYVAAKRRYRATPRRIGQLQEALDRYRGTKNYHNYTVQKTHADPSAKRLMRSFVVNPAPIRIGDTEWLSLKVHGQSFMMHQIRKMVGMAVLATRCATPLDRIDQSYGPDRISIPKAPGLGLLLERPVFDNYNKRAVDSYGLDVLDFSKYEAAIDEFKNAQIYKHIFELEEKENSFHTFFHQIDNFKSDYFLWLTAGGIAAAQTRLGPQEDIPKELDAELGDDGEENPDEGEG